VELSVTPSLGADGRHVLRVSGAVDLTSRDLVLQAATKALAGPSPTGLVLDLSGVNFFDSTAIGAVVQIAAEAEDVGVGFALRDPSERVMRVLMISGLRDAWPIEQAD
jgi:anti-sigma B factor antagonist